MMAVASLNASRISELSTECVGWNVYPWRKGLEAILHHVGAEKFSSARVLEVGASAKSSLTPIFAAHGASCTASYWDSNPTSFLDRITAKFTIERPIAVERLDILNSPHEKEFDFVIAKSVLGGLASQWSDGVAVAKALANMRKAVVPGGKIFLLENGYGSCVHAVLRRTFGAGRDGWHYFTHASMREVVSPDTIEMFQSFGFFTFAGFRVAAIDRAAVMLDRVLAPHISPPRRVVFALVATADVGG
jgi:SAM-dependent methyltransferase